MTLHTRVMVTTPGIDPRAAFDKMRELIGATEQYRMEVHGPDPDSEREWERNRTHSFDMVLGQGLPALLWVDHNNGALVSEGGHDEWCDEECQGTYDDPAGFVQIHYDTAYGYRADNNASCSDLHAWLTVEITNWLTAQGASWVWYDESGTGWHDDLSDFGALGDPEIGRIGSSVDRLEKDEKREFGALALAAILAEHAGGAS